MKALETLILIMVNALLLQASSLNSDVVKQTIEHAFSYSNSGNGVTSWKLIEPVPQLPLSDSVTALPTIIHHSGIHTVWLQTWRKGLRCKTVGVKVDVVKQAKVAVVKKPIKSGEPLSGAFDTILREIGVLNDRAIKPEDANGMVAVRDINAGEVVQVGWAKQPYAVRRNSPVTVLSGADNVSVQVDGIASMDGRVGDRVAVKTSVSKQSLWGRVEGPGVVRVQ